MPNDIFLVFVRRTRLDVSQAKGAAALATSGFIVGILSQNDGEYGCHVL